MTSTLEAALAYLARGWVVMAVPEGSKVRRRPWRHLQLRIPTPEEVRRDFAQEPGVPNIALIAGSVSRLAVVEADTAEAAARLEALNLPPTLTAKACRGPHRYFRTDREVHTRKLDGLELRAEGSYVLAPPSIHPSGLVYAFEDPDAPVTELPAEVLVLFGTETARASRPDPSQVPERWLRLVESNPRTRAAWEGQGRHQDRSGSGRDLFLAHEARRCGFGPEEARRIVLAAPWSVEGGRTSDYLSRTLARAYQAGKKRETPAYGQVPAAIMDDGTFAKLTWPEKGLLTVLLVRRMRPSNTVLRSAELLARDLGVDASQVRRTAAKLEDRGLIQRRRVAGGRTVYQLSFFSPCTPCTVREEQPGAAPEAEATVHGVTVHPEHGKKSGHTVHPEHGKPVLVHDEEERSESKAPVTPPSSPESGEAENGASPPPRSLRHIWEILPTGERVVFEKRPDGDLVEVGRTLPETEEVR